MSGHLKIVLQLLRLADPLTILEVCDRDSAQRLAIDVLRSDDDARREFANASTLGAYLWSLARPQEQSARQRLPEALRWQAEQAQAAEVRRAAIAAAVEAAMARLAKPMPAPAPQPARPSVAPPPPPLRRTVRPSVAASPSSSKSSTAEWGSIDQLAEALECRAPLLRLPSSVRILADHGIAPERHGRVERWPLGKFQDAAAVRRAMLLAASAAVFIDSGVQVATIG